MMKTMKGFVQYLRENENKIDQRHACYVDLLNNHCCVLTHAAIYFGARPDYGVVFPESLMETYFANDYDVLNEVPRDQRHKVRVTYAGDGHSALFECVTKELGLTSPHELLLQDNIIDATGIFEEHGDVFSSEPWPMPPAEVFERTYPSLTK